MNKTTNEDRKVFHCPNCNVESPLAVEVSYDKTKIDDYVKDLQWYESENQRVREAREEERNDSERLYQNAYRLWFIEHSLWENNLLSRLFEEEPKEPKRFEFSFSSHDLLEIPVACPVKPLCHYIQCATCGYRHYFNKEDKS